MSVDAHGYPFVARSGRLPLGPKARVGTVRVSHRRVRPPRALANERAEPVARPSDGSLSSSECTVNSSTPKATSSRLQATGRLKSSGGGDLRP